MSKTYAAHIMALKERALVIAVEARVEKTQRRRAPTVQELAVTNYGCLREGLTTKQSEIWAMG
jgi:hypothetical protein